MVSTRAISGFELFTLKTYFLLTWSVESYPAIPKD